MITFINNYTLIILALIFPPIPVIYQRGFKSKSLLTNIIWNFIGYIPGLLHSIYVIAQGDGYNKERYYWYHKCPSFPLLEINKDKPDEEFEPDQGGSCALPEDPEMV